MNNTTTSNWQEFGNTRVIELINDVKEYMSNGVKKETALKIVRSETMIGNKYWAMVVENA